MFSRESARALFAASLSVALPVAVFAQNQIAANDQPILSVERQIAPAFAESQAEIDAADVALKAAPKNASALAQKGEALERIGELKESVADYNVSFVYLNEAIKTLDLALANKQDDGQIIVLKAHAQVSLGRLQGARHEPADSSIALKSAFELYQQALLKSPGNSNLLVGLAETQGQIADLQWKSFDKHWAFINFESALDNLEVILRRQPNNVEALNEKARVYVLRSELLTQTKGLKEAHSAIDTGLNTYQRALQVDANNRESLYGLAKAYLTDGENGASQQMNEFMSRNADPRYLKHPRKLRVMAAAAESYRLALDACSTALKLYPSDVQLLWLRADAGERLADCQRDNKALAVKGYSEALASLDALSTQMPGSYGLYSKKNQLLWSRALRQNSSSAAATDYALSADAERKALSFKPADAYSNLRLVKCFYKGGCEWSKSGQWQKSRAALKDALEASDSEMLAGSKEISAYWLENVDEQKGRIYCELARVDVGEGNYTAAVEHVSQAIAIFKARRGTAYYANSLGLCEGLALWTKGRWQAKMGRREAALEAYQEASNAFSICMKKQSKQVVARYGRGDLIISAESLTAKLSQGSRKPFSYDQAKKAIEKHVNWSN